MGVLTVAISDRERASVESCRRKREDRCEERERASSEGQDYRSETAVLAGRRQCAAEGVPGQMSEIKSQPKLEPARTAGRERLSKEWPKIRIRPRYPDVGMVENVESICPKLERTGFKDPEVFSQTEIDYNIAQTR